MILFCKHENFGGQKNIFLGLRSYVTDKRIIFKGPKFKRCASHLLKTFCFMRNCGLILDINNTISWNRYNFEESS